MITKRLFRLCWSQRGRLLTYLLAQGHFSGWRSSASSNSKGLMYTEIHTEHLLLRSLSQVCVCVCHCLPSVSIFLLVHCQVLCAVVMFGVVLCCFCVSVCVVGVLFCCLLFCLSSHSAMLSSSRGHNRVGCLVENLEKWKRSCRIW